MPGFEPNTLVPAPNLLILKATAKQCQTGLLTLRTEAHLNLPISPFLDH